MHSLNTLMKAQINQIQDVSQKVTMHRAYSNTQAMDDLFKYNILKDFKNAPPA